MVKFIVIQGYPQRMRLKDDHKLMKYKDFNIKISRLQNSISMAYLMIWQKKKQVSIF